MISKGKNTHTEPALLKLGGMRRYLVFFVVGLALLLFAVTSSSVAVAFPALISDLDTSLLQAGWVLSVYQLVSITTLPLAGKISETRGRRTTFMLCTLLFTVGSVLCAIAPNVGWLIAFRAVQAAGGGGFLPCAAGIVAEEFPEARQRAIGLFSSIIPVGMIIGPNLGGWLVEAFGWRSTFWLNVPLGVIVLVLSRVLISSEGQTRPGRIDFIGAGLLLSSITAIMLGLTELGNTESGISWVLVGLSFASGIGLLFVLLRRERRVSEPIIDVGLLKEKAFLAANIYNLVYGACAVGIFALMPLYTVSIYGKSILESGVILTPRSVGIALASTVTSFSLVKWGYRRPILIGTLTVALSLVLFALEPQGIAIFGFRIGDTALLLIIMAICGIGTGIATPAANNACIELMPDRVATITGLRGMFRQLGGAISIAIATVVLHVGSNIDRAFYFVLLGLALILVMTLPAIFAMPSSPNARPE